MERMKFNKELYPRVALIKAAYNFTDVAYMHLDVDDKYYYVDFEMKESNSTISEKDFLNEMLAQSVRHEIYGQTKDIRELLLARAMATSVVYDEGDSSEETYTSDYDVDDILKDWFEENE